MPQRRPSCVGLWELPADRIGKRNLSGLLTPVPGRHRVHPPREGGAPPTAPGGDDSCQGGYGVEVEGERSSCESQGTPLTERLPNPPPSNDTAHLPGPLERHCTTKRHNAAPVRRKWTAPRRRSSLPRSVLPSSGVGRGWSGSAGIRAAIRRLNAASKAARSRGVNRERKAPAVGGRRKKLPAWRGSAAGCGRTGDGYLGSLSAQESGTGNPH